MIGGFHINEKMTSSQHHIESIIDEIIGPSSYQHQPDWID